MLGVEEKKFSKVADAQRGEGSPAPSPLWGEGRGEGSKNSISWSHMILPNHHPLIRRQFAQAHRATGVEALRGDGDFRAEAELPAVRKARARVDVHCRRVHFGDEARGVGVVVRQDSIRVRGAVYGDVLHRFI